MVPMIFLNVSHAKYLVKPNVIITKNQDHGHLSFYWSFLSSETLDLPFTCALANESELRPASKYCQRNIRSITNNKNKLKLKISKHQEQKFIIF